MRFDIRRGRGRCSTQDFTIAMILVSISFLYGHESSTSRRLKLTYFYLVWNEVAHMPFNAKPTKRGSNFVHVGIDVKLYAVPGSASLWGSRYPRFHYNERQTPEKAYWHAIKLNSFLNMAAPWRIKTVHGLPELQKRIARAKLVAEAAKRQKYPFLKSTLDEAYEAMVYKRKE